MRRGKRDCIRQTDRQTDRQRQETRERPEEGRGGRAGWLLGWSAQAHWKRLGRSTDAFWIGDLLASSALSGRRNPPTQQRTSSPPSLRLLASPLAQPPPHSRLLTWRSGDHLSMRRDLSVSPRRGTVVHHLDLTEGVWSEVREVRTTIWRKVMRGELEREGWRSGAR
jgi:hypothetical protein